MPELPEVHTIVSQLRRKLRGRTIERLTSWDARKALQPTPAAVTEAVRGVRISDVQRRAKLILIELSSGATLAVHLKLTGRLLLRRASDPPDPYTHAMFALNGGHELRFADVRKFGYIRLLRSKDEVARLLNEYGPEPLTSTFTHARLAEILRGRSMKIKPLLMDQSVISGIGNIYSDEALFAAKINPRRPAKSLTPHEIRRLHCAVSDVLTAGIAHHGTSDQWFVDAHGRKGSHQNHLRVYGRENEPCPRCSAPIRRLKFGGRSSHFCPQCQR